MLTVPLRNGSVGHSPGSAAASAGIASLVRGPVAVADILGRSSAAAWLEVGGTVVVVTADGSARLPNEIALISPAGMLGMAATTATLGAGRLQLGDAVAAIDGWWSPRMAVARDPAPITSAVAASRLELSTVVSAELAPLLDSPRSATDTSALIGRLGLGPGLTPVWDDVAVGVLAGLQLLGPAIDPATARRRSRRLALAVTTEAPRRTTKLSTTLLRHAAIGEFAGVIGDFVKGLAAGTFTTDGISAMGATSGLGTAYGVVAGVMSLDIGSKP